MEVLEAAHIERIASALASQSAAPAEPLEELAYRRSLRVALDALNESAGLPQESPAEEERATPCSQEKPTEEASLLCDPGSSCLQEAVLGASGLERRERVPPRLSGSPTRKKDLEYNKKLLRKSGRCPLPPAGGGSQEGSGSRPDCASRTAPGKGGRGTAGESSVGQSVPSLSEGGGNKSLRAPGSPPREEEEGLWVKGRDPSLRLRGPPALPGPGCPACPDAQGRPAKRLCPDGVQRPPASQPEPGAVPSPRRGPGRCMTLRSAARVRLPAPPASTEDTRYLRVPVEEAQERPSSGESMEFAPIRSLLEEDEDDEEPPRILLYHGKARGAARVHPRAEPPLLARPTA